MKKHIHKINLSTKTIILILFVMICHSMAFSQTNPPLENLTGKIKTDEKGMRYIDNPDMPNGREYLLNTNVTSFDLYERYADTHSESDEWLSGSPVQFYAPEGYDTKMNLTTLKNPKLREDYFAKQKAQHLQSQIHTGLVFIIAIIFTTLFSIFLIKYLKK